MEEHEKDEQWTDVFHGQHKQVDKAYVGGSPVCDFIMHHFVVHIPTNEKAGEESTDRQTAIGREPIEEAKERHTEE